MHGYWREYWGVVVVEEVDGGWGDGWSGKEDGDEAEG